MTTPSRTARTRVADFWDEVLEDWAANGEHPSDDLRRWREAYPGHVDDEHYPDPYVGDLRGGTHDPKVVLLGLNPGIGYDELQGRGGTWTRRVAEQGYSHCFERSPEEDPTGWEAVHGKRSPYWVKAVYFARRWLQDPAASHRDILNLELFPWHSAGLTAKINPPSDLVDTYVWAPLAEVDTPAVFGFGADWFRVAADAHLEEVGLFGHGGTPIPGLSSEDRSRWRVGLFRLNERQFFVTSAQLGSSNPPGKQRVELLRGLVGSYV